MLEKIFKKVINLMPDELIGVIQERQTYGNTSVSKIIGYWQNEISMYGDLDPPSIPSLKDLKNYEAALKDQKPIRTLILGATPALRDLAAIHSKECVVADITFETIIGFLRYTKNVDPLKEIWVRANWLDLPFPDNYFDCIVGDLVLNQIELSDHGKFLLEMKRLINQDGKISMRCTFRNEKYVNKEPALIIENTLREFKNNPRLTGHVLCWRLQSRFVNSKNKMDIGAIKNSLKIYLATHNNLPSFLENIIKSNIMAWTQLAKEELISLFRDYFTIHETYVSDDYADSDVFPIIVLKR